MSIKQWFAQTQCKVGYSPIILDMRSTMSVSSKASAKRGCDKTKNLTYCKPRGEDEKS